ncbi:hypothetical protein [Turicibacter sanguinis]|uniref:hypothetical protein n=1 Tax=Turicibacter sanguinis TaxID=154288 RepID=UPI0018AA2714|nr:hypothetical protein [Turicibacter sanguinis]MDB8553246.1 hypothetical protein [Turicibacter sanguinis]
MSEVVQTLYNIEDYDSVMTVFFVKRTGKIKMIADGRQDMSMFGDDEIEQSMIWDYVVVEKDDFIKDNTNQFYVDSETKELIYTPLINTSKYRMR